MKYFKQNRFTVPSLVLAALSLSTVASFGVASFGADWDDCSGDPIKWRKPIAIQRNSCSITTNGIRHQAYNNGVLQWDDLTSEVDQFLVRPIGDCTITDGDGINEVAVVSRASIDGNNGRTTMVSGPCVPPFNNDLDQGDVKIAATLSNGSPMPFENQSATSLGSHGRDTFVHEFGHFFGFNHRNNNMAAMHTTSIPKVGGSQSASVFPDDVLGIQALYGLNSSLPNLLASAHEVLADTSTVLLDTGTSSRCRGQSITVRFYLGNAGSSASGTYQLLYTVQNESTTFITSSNSFTHSIGAFTEGTHPLSLTIPTTVPNGTYLIRLLMDQPNVVSETRDHDNISYSGKRVIVNC
jgi:hypothetical protein